MEGLIPREDDDMPAQRKYPPELRERAIRLVQEARAQDGELSLNQTVIRIGQRVGVNADTLRGWCKQAEVDVGARPGSTRTDSTPRSDISHRSNTSRCITVR